MLIVLVNWGSYDVTAESVGDLVAEDDGELVVVVVIAHLQHSRVDENVPGLEKKQKSERALRRFEFPALFICSVLSQTFGGEIDFSSLR